MSVEVYSETQVEVYQRLYNASNLFERVSPRIERELIGHVDWLLDVMLDVEYIRSDDFMPEDMV